MGSCYLSRGRVTRSTGPASDMGSDPFQTINLPVGRFRQFLVSWQNTSAVIEPADRLVHIEHVMDKGDQANQVSGY